MKTRYQFPLNTADYRNEGYFIDDSLETHSETTASEYNTYYEWFQLGGLTIVLRKRDEAET